MRESGKLKKRNIPMIPTRQQLYGFHQTPLFCVNLGWSCSMLLPVRRGVCCRDHLLTLASPVLEITGWIPRGCWCRLALWFEDLCYVAPSSPLPSSSGKQSPLLPISPCVIEYLSCIWFEGGEIPEMWQLPLRPATQHPVIEAWKCGCHFQPLGHG